MRRALGLFLAAASVLGAIVPAAPAAAQGEKIEMEQLDRVYLRFSGPTRDLRKLMRCQLAKNPEIARALFLHAYGSLEQQQALSAFYGSGEFTSCLRVGVRRLTAQALAGMGALADALIDLDGIEAPAARMPSWQNPGGGAFVWTWQRITGEQEALHIPVANCLVNEHPAKVAEVLATDETSNNERRQFNSMSAEIVDCIPTGERLTLNPMVLRPALAVGFYSSARLGSEAAE